MGTGSFPG